MIGVVLLYPGAMRNFWLSGDGMAIIKEFFAKFQKAGLRAVALGDDDGLLKAVSATGAKIFKDNGLPEGETDWRIRVARAVGRLRKLGFEGEDLLFLDHRFVFLSDETLQRAIEMHREIPGQPVVSLSKTDDFFPQCVTPWAVVSAGPLHIRKEDTPAYGHTVVSRPFRYHWQSGLAEGPYACVSGPFGFEFHPASPGQNYFDTNHIWIKRGELAQIYYTPKTKDDYGLSWAETCFETTPRLKSKSGNTGFLLSFPDLRKGWPYSLWLYPFHEQTLFCSRTEHYQLESTASKVEIIDNGQAGWWYLLARESENADFVTPYCPQEGTWRLNSDLKPYDAESAIPLGRRQDMHPSYIADGGLLLFPAACRVAPENRLDLINARFLPLDKPENHAVRNEIDAIRMKVIRKMNKERKR